MGGREPVTRGEAMMIAAVVVGFGTEGGKTPYRLAYAQVGASGHSVGVMQTDFGQNPRLAPGYVDAVIADAGARGMRFDAGERAEILRRIVTRNPDWEDVPAKFKQAANAFGDSATGQQWIHDNLDSRFLAIAVKQVEAFDAALAKRGIALDPATREETFAMVAKIANQAGEGRSAQLLEAIEDGTFTGLRKAKGTQLDYPLPAGVPPAALASEWIAGFATTLERDGVSSVLAKGVGHARDFGRRYHRITATPRASAVLDVAEAKYAIADLKPAAFREKPDLAAIKKWVTTGRIERADIDAAQAFQAGPPVVPPRPVRILAAQPNRNVIGRVAEVLDGAVLVQTGANTFVQFDLDTLDSQPAVGARVGLKSGPDGRTAVRAFAGELPFAPAPERDVDGRDDYPARRKVRLTSGGLER